MADNASMMALMQGAGGATPGGVSVGDAPPPSPPPMPSPMSTPEPKAGVKEAALVNVSMAMDLIEQALPAIGSESPEGQKLINAISALTTVLGPKKQKAGELQNAEILQLLQNLPQAGGGTPGSRMIAGAPPNLGLMNPPGAPPMPAGGGAPAGAPPAMPPM
jgi:hypothetical protein